MLPAQATLLVVLLCVLLGSSKGQGGVQLSLNGNRYSNSSVLIITEIGERYNGLQCRTDRSPCCNTLGYRAGQWYFPDPLRTLVPIQGSATTFYRNRGDDGTVNLNRLSGVMSPTGLFCCEVPNAIGINQRLCAYIVPQVSVQISNNGVSATTGENYTLTCSYSGYENHIWNDEPIVVTRWTKTGGTPTQLNTDVDNQLTFSSLKLSDAGEYTCTVEIYDGTVVLSRRSRHTTIYLLVPSFEIILVTDDEQQPVLSQSNVTLTCIVEFNPLVDVPVAVYTNITGPQTAEMTLATRVKYTKYSGSLSVTPNTGTYQCTPIIDGLLPYIHGHQGSRSARKSLVVGDAFFQLKLLNINNCRMWTHDQVSSYRTYIRNAVLEALQFRCQCKINLLEGKFSCRNSINHVTYRGVLTGTHNTNATELLKFLQDWVNTGPTIEMDWYYVDIDNSCPVAVSSPTEPECIQSLIQNGNNSSYTRCAQHLSDPNIAQCFEGCIARNDN